MKDNIRSEKSELSALGLRLGFRLGLGLRFGLRFRLRFGLCFSLCFRFSFSLSFRFSCRFRLGFRRLCSWLGLSLGLLCRHKTLQPLLRNLLAHRLAAERRLQQTHQA